MRVVVRTLSPQDAEMLARTIVTGVVSNGCVERHDLRWRSDALRSWEISQRGLGKKPEVRIRIDELNLAVVYVEPLDGSGQIVRAISTLPKYTHALSLYEHRKVKEKMKADRLRDRIVQMGDEHAFNLRIEYYATLGRANDPVAYRRLVGLRDQLAALRVEGQNSDGTKVIPVEANVVVPEASVKPLPNRKRKIRRDSPVPASESDQPPTSSSSPMNAQSQEIRTEPAAAITRKFPHAIVKRIPL